MIIILLALTMMFMLVAGCNNAPIQSDASVGLAESETSEDIPLETDISYMESSIFAGTLLTIEFVPGFQLECFIDDGEYNSRVAEFQIQCVNLG